MLGPPLCTPLTHFFAFMCSTQVPDTVLALHLSALQLPLLLAALFQEPQHSMHGVVLQVRSRRCP